ncbi:MAG: hypothetical protein IPH58_04670 [Sphingobacteriales bacterium]|nr:hypothetical protein [Sphingobacteriales bacterium]
MSVKENRDIVIERVRKEIIGPGSDRFIWKEDCSDEIIEGKPLQRYFQAFCFQNSYNQMQVIMASWK